MYFATPVIFEGSLFSSVIAVGLGWIMYRLFGSDSPADSKYCLARLAFFSKRRGSANSLLNHKLTLKTPISTVTLDSSYRDSSMIRYEANQFNKLPSLRSQELRDRSRMARSRQTSVGRVRNRRG